MAGLQLNALSFQKSSWAQHRVSEVTTDIVERMQTNPVASQKAYYNYTETYAVTAATTLTSNGCRESTSTIACTPQKIAGDDVSSWLAKAQKALPGGAVSISGTTTEGFVVTTMYLDKDFRDSITNTPTTSVSCTPTPTGNAWRTCCPTSAAAPPGVRCSRTPFFVYVDPGLASQ